MADDVELLPGAHELPELPSIKHPLQALLAEKITEDMLQAGAIACEILVEHVGHLALENEHPGKDVAAVALAFLLEEGTVSKDFTQTGAGEDFPEVVVQRIFPGFEIVPGAGLLGMLHLVHLARAGGIEPPLPGWKPAIRPRKPVCCHYTKPVWGGAEDGSRTRACALEVRRSRSEVLRAAVTLLPLECLTNLRKKTGNQEELRTAA